jgi:predicted DNA-binding protein (UPF0251 family)
LHTEFKPIGVQRNRLELLPLGLDEFEAIRLADYLGMEHSEAAMEMEISRSTFTRLIEKARSKIARFLVEGKHLQIEGGNIHFRGNLIRCHDCGHMFNMEFDSNIRTCPACGSGNLIDLAGGFGHGNCCRGHGRHGRR